MGSGLFRAMVRDSVPNSVKILYLKFNRGCRRIDLMGGEISKDMNGRIGTCINLVRQVPDLVLKN
jgi:hypothetical protein